MFRLLRYLDIFVLRRYCNDHRPFTISRQLTTIDLEMIDCVWQEDSQIDDKTVVFVYLLVRHVTLDDIDPHTLVRVCVYVTYSYIASETSYPLKPFTRGCNCTREQFLHTACLLYGSVARSCYVSTLIDATTTNFIDS